MADGGVGAIETCERPGTDHGLFALAFADEEGPQVVEAENDGGRVRSFGL